MEVLTAATILGALRVGIVPVVLNRGLLAHERDALLVDAEPSLVVDDELLDAMIAQDHQVDLSRYPLARPMHYTSGTTGVPKGVWTGVLSEAEAEAEALYREEADLWAFDALDRPTTAPSGVPCPIMHDSSTGGIRARRGRRGARNPTVFGLDDETWGQRVCAAVVADRASASSCEPSVVLAYAKAMLAGYKCPKEVFLVDELPHTATGKVQRRRLPELLGLDR